MKHLKHVLWVLLVLCVSPVMAQRPSCPAIVEAALRAVDDYCEDTSRNQACYGNVALEATPRENVTDFSFATVGDIENVADLAMLKLEPMDEIAGTWGVAMMKLQANLPGTIPGQNVTFLFFGDVEIENAVTPEDEEHNPMQAFYLRSGIGDAPCAEAPESGLLVQTPDGVGSVAFTMNGVEVSLGSTVFFQVDEETGMNVTTIEGSAALMVGGDKIPVLAGSLVDIPMDADLNPDIRAIMADPPVPQPYTAEQVAPLPVQVMERDVTIATPMTQQQINHVVELVAQGQPICGQPGLPSCHHVPEEFGGTDCRIEGDTSADLSLPICESESGDGGENAESTEEAGSDGDGGSSAAPQPEVTAETTPEPTSAPAPPPTPEATPEPTPSESGSAPLPTPEASEEASASATPAPEVSPSPTPQLSGMIPVPTETPTGEPTIEPTEETGSDANAGGEATAQPTP